MLMFVIKPNNILYEIQELVFLSCFVCISHIVNEWQEY